MALLLAVQTPMTPSAALLPLLLRWVPVQSLTTS
jgi:hypothetical protein